MNQKEFDTYIHFLTAEIVNNGVPSQEYMCELVVAAYQAIEAIDMVERIPVENNDAPAN